MIFKDLGVIEYKKAWDYQEELLQSNVAIKSARRKELVDFMLEPLPVGDTNVSYSPMGQLPSSNPQPANLNPQPATRNYFLLCEHPPVYTLGKSGKKEHVLLSNNELLQHDIAFYQTNRGGDITFHGLQQIVGYPILDLENYGTDIGRYLRNLEELIILTISEFGLKGERSKGETGVWIEPGVPGRERKICAIGVRCSRWITMHGFALNVNTDLRYFDHIIPCGIRNKQVTSIEKELGWKLDYTEVKEKIKMNFEKVFNSVLK